MFLGKKYKLVLVFRSILNGTSYYLRLLTAIASPSAAPAHPFHTQTHTGSQTTEGWSLCRGNGGRREREKIGQGFPGGAVVESLPAHAGDTGSSPGLGGSHMPRSNWAREPQLLSLCSATREATIVRGLHTVMKSGPHLLQLEKALAQRRRPNTAKNK